MIDLSIVYSRIKERGLVRTSREAWNILRSAFARADAFDQIFGTDTARPRRLWGLKINSSNLIDGVFYQTSDPAVIESALRSLRIDFSTFTFLDLGCGKGRPLMIAAKLGFGRVVGVDFSAELCAIARNNLRIAGVAGEVLCADVCELQFPDGPLVVYLFNPFGSKVLHGVCENLRASLRSKPRQCFLAYLNPVHAEVFDLAGFTRCGGGASVALWRCGSVA